MVTDFGDGEYFRKVIEGREDAIVTGDVRDVWFRAGGEQLHFGYVLDFIGFEKGFDFLTLVCSLNAQDGAGGDQIDEGLEKEA